MKLSLKAALCSGLIFPGSGQLVLKQYARASAFISVALFSLYIISIEIFERATAIVEQMQAKQILLDPIAIRELMSSPPVDATDTTLNIASWIFVLCWLASIVDAYRNGRKRDTSEE